MVFRERDVMMVRMRDEGGGGSVPRWVCRDIYYIGER